jgi:hypothetical protein
MRDILTDALGCLALFLFLFLALWAPAIFGG